MATSTTVPKLSEFYSLYSANTPVAVLNALNTTASQSTVITSDGNGGTYYGPILSSNISLSTVTTLSWQSTPLLNVSSIYANHESVSSLFVNRAVGNLLTISTLFITDMLSPNIISTQLIYSSTMNVGTLNNSNLNISSVYAQYESVSSLFVNRTVGNLATISTLIVTDMFSPQVISTPLIYSSTLTVGTLNTSNLNLGPVITISTLNTENINTNNISANIALISTLNVLDTIYAPLISSARIRATTYLSAPLINVSTLNSSDLILAKTMNVDTISVSRINVSSINIDNIRFTQSSFTINRLNTSTLYASDLISVPLLTVSSIRCSDLATIPQANISTLYISNTIYSSSIETSSIKVHNNITFGNSNSVQKNLSSLVMLTESLTISDRLLNPQSVYLAFALDESNGTKDSMVFTSTDGYNWDPYIQPLANVRPTGPKALNYANYLWVCGVTPTSPETATIITSTDAINWNRIQAFTGTGARANGVAYGNGVWVAVGAGTYKILYSTDAVTWLPATGSLFTTSGNSVYYANGRFVAVGNDTTKSILISDDGRIWSSPLTTSSAYTDITYGNGLWVAVGSNILRSTDNGNTWIGFILSDYPPPAGLTFSSVSFSNNKFVCLVTLVEGTPARIYYTTDSYATVWALLTSNNLDTGNYIEYINYINGTLYAFGTNQSLYGIIYTTNNVSISNTNFTPLNLVNAQQYTINNVVLGNVSNTLINPVSLTTKSISTSIINTSIVNTDFINSIRNIYTPNVYASSLQIFQYMSIPQINVSSISISDSINLPALLTASTFRVSNLVSVPTLQVSSINATTVNSQFINASTIRISQFMSIPQINVSSISISDNINLPALLTASTFRVSDLVSVPILQVSSILASAVNSRFITASTLQISDLVSVPSLQVSSINVSDSIIGRYITASSIVTTNLISVPILSISTLQSQNINTTNLVVSNAMSNNIIYTSTLFSSSINISSIQSRTIIVSSMTATSIVSQGYTTFTYSSALNAGTTVPFLLSNIGIYEVASYLTPGDVGSYIKFQSITAANGVRVGSIITPLTTISPIISTFNNTVNGTITLNITNNALTTQTVIVNIFRMGV